MSKPQECGNMPVPQSGCSLPPPPWEWPATTPNSRRFPSPWPIMQTGRGRMRSPARDASQQADRPTARPAPPAEDQRSDHGRAGPGCDWVRVQRLQPGPRVGRTRRPQRGRLLRQDPSCLQSVRVPRRATSHGRAHQGSTGAPPCTPSDPGREGGRRCLLVPAGTCLARVNRRMVRRPFVRREP